MICMYYSCRFLDDLVDYFFHFSLSCCTKDLLLGSRSFDSICATACQRDLVYFVIVL